MYCIGIDIGGMSIKAGVVDKDGKIVKKGKVVTDVAAGEHKIINDIGRLVLSLADPNDRDFVGIGIGCPGAINSSTGVVDRAFNLNWHKVALAEELARMINKPIKVSNDANVAALGETMFGVGRMYTDTVFLTIGTGVGGGIVLGGKLYEGNESKGAELGLCGSFRPRSTTWTGARRSSAVRRATVRLTRLSIILSSTSAKACSTLQTFSVRKQ